MRVLHVIRSLDPKCGGPPSAIRTIVPEQIRRGHEVAILTTTCRHRETEGISQEAFLNAMREDPAFEGVDLCMAPAHEGIGPTRAFAYAPKGVRWLRHQIRVAGRAPDIIHLHEVFGYLHAMVPGIARGSSIPYIFRPAGALDETCFKRGHRLLKSLFSQCWLKRGIQKAAFIHLTSHLEAQQIKHLSDWFSEDRIRLIPFGLRLGEYDAADAVRAFQTMFPQLVGHRTILHAARIHAIKRLDWVVEAMSLLPPEFADVKLLVAGSDNGFRTVVERVVRKCQLEDRVIFAGFLSGQVKYGAFEASDVFVMPSVHENYGFSVVEALAHGTPSIVTRGVASSVYVEKSGAGVVVGDSPRSIAEGLRVALSMTDPKLRQRARDYIKKNLSHESALSAIDAMYNDAVNGSRRH